MARLFVAAWPPADVVDRLLRLSRPAQRGVRWVGAENWHITLRFIGDAEPAAVRACLDVTTFPAARAELGPVVERLGRDAVVLPVHGLEELASVVGRSTAEVGRPRDDRAFYGHLSLARLKDRSTVDLLGARFDDRFEVTEVTLVESTLSHDSARYEIIGRWPTVGAS